MQSEDDLRDRLADAATTTSTAPAVSIVTSSPPPFRRDVRDFFKRHRPFTDKSRGTFKPRRMVSCTSADSALSDDAKLVVGKVGMNLTAWRKDEFSMIGKAQDASITPPSTLPAKRLSTTRSRQR